MEETLDSLRTSFFDAAGRCRSIQSGPDRHSAETPHFTGRDALLGAIHNAFEEGNSLSLTQATEGLGGVSKTQLALKYA